MDGIKERNLILTWEKIFLFLSTWVCDFFPSTNWETKKGVQKHKEKGLEYP